MPLQKTFTLSEMKNANKAAGQYWFDEGTLRFFNTRFITPNDRWNMFITGETGPTGVEKYTVRMFVPYTSKVLTVGPFNELDGEQAEELQRVVREALDTMGARETAVFVNVKTIGPWESSPEDCLEFSAGEYSFVIRTTDARIVN